MCMMDLKTLLDILTEDTDPTKGVLFDVKRVGSCQDYARLQDVYYDLDDEKLVLVLG